MNSAAVDIAAYLVSRGVGVAAAAQAVPSEASWPISVGREAREPINTITVYDTPGRSPDTHEMDVYRPNVQVRVRSSRYLAGEAKARLALTELTAVLLLSIGGTRYVAVQPITDVNYVGHTEQDAYLFTVNFSVVRQA